MRRLTASTSRRLLPLVAGATLSLGLLAAQAQPVSAPVAPQPGASAPAQGWHHRAERGNFDPVARAQDHLARLKTELKITPAQDKAWQGFAAQVSQQAETMKKRFAQRPDPKAEAQMHAPERMAQHLAQMQERLKDMQALRDRVADLYAVLTPAQQTQADQHFARMGREMREHMGHGMEPGMGRPGPMGPGMGPGPHDGGPDMPR